MIKRLLKSPFRAISKLQARRSISQLRSQNDPTLRSLGEAIGETLNDELSPLERSWIEKIELLRMELCDSKSEIQKVDYGAGAPDSNLSSDQMSRGTLVTQSIGDICRIASKPPIWSLLLFKLVRKFKPSSCLELGTCLGISASFQGAALQLNGSGKMTSLEGDPSLASKAQKNLDGLGLDNVSVVCGRFADTLAGVLKSVGAVDYAFIDGHHDERATLEYFEQIAQFAFERTLLVFDDISWSEGMKRAWHALELDNRIKISLDLGPVGVCVLDQGRRDKRTLSVPLES